MSFSCCGVLLLLRSERVKYFTQCLSQWERNNFLKTRSHRFCPVAMQGWLVSIPTWMMTSIEGSKATASQRKGLSEFRKPLLLLVQIAVLHGPQNQHNLGSVFSYAALATACSCPRAINDWNDPSKWESWKSRPISVIPPVLSVKISNINVWSIFYRISAIWIL